MSLGQNQFTVTSDAQVVLLCLMNDDDLALALKEVSAFDPGLFIRRRGWFNPGGIGSFSVENRSFLFHLLSNGAQTSRAKAPTLAPVLYPAVPVRRAIFSLPLRQRNQAH